MNRQPERGQILVLGAAVMVILIVIAGLVIDLGFSWMLRRAAQNAVDPASIAAARYIPAGDLGAMEEAACFYARENGFFDSATSYDLSSSGCVPANDPHGSVLTVNWPPASGPYAGNYGYVEVILNGGHATFFSKILGFDWLTVTTGAVSANFTGGSGGGQLVALDPTTCRSGQIRGNALVYVGGSIYVNSDGSTPPPGCMGDTDDDMCSGGDGAFAFSGGQTRLVTPQVSVRGSCGQASNPFPNNCSPSTSCVLTEGAGPIEDPLAGIPIPTIGSQWGLPPAPGDSSAGTPPDLSACDGPADTGCTFGGGWVELNPGVYYGGWIINGEVRLNPGFYYIAGGGIQVQGNAGAIVTISNPATGVPDGDGRILLYSTDGPNCQSPAPADPLDPNYRLCQGTITFTGQSSFRARGYDANLSDPIDQFYHRILIWQREGTSRTLFADTDLANDEVRIAGLGAMEYYGTIYAPKSLVAITGNGSGTGIAGVQILAWRFDVGGNGYLNMPFVPEESSPIVNKGLVQ